MPVLTWHSNAGVDRAQLVLAGLIPFTITVRRTAWEVEGGDGRRRTGACSTHLHGRQLALQAIVDAMRDGLKQAESAARAPM